jgi:hypothetical protein
MNLIEKLDPIFNLQEKKIQINLNFKYFIKNNNKINLLF